MIFCLDRLYPCLCIPKSLAWWVSTFPDNTFDMVVAMYVASVVPDPVQLVDEIRRVCKPQGKIVFLNHFQKNHRWIGKFEKLIQPLSGHLGFSPNFSKESFLSKTGFRVTQEIPVNIFKYWTLLIGRNEKPSLH